MKCSPSKYSPEPLWSRSCDHYCDGSNSNLSIQLFQNALTFKLSHKLSFFITKLTITKMYNSSVSLISGRKNKTTFTNCILKHFCSWIHWSLCAWHFIVSCMNSFTTLNFIPGVESPHSCSSLDCWKMCGRGLVYIAQQPGRQPLIRNRSWRVINSWKASLFMVQSQGTSKSMHQTFCSQLISEMGVRW